MMSADVIVVGSGPAGTFAARQLRGLDVLVLDVGKEPARSGEELDRNLYDLKESGRDLFEPVLGAGFESLHNVHQSYLSPKLKAPLVRFVTDEWKTLGRFRPRGFDPVASYARGGLANAWGAGCFRFEDRELEGFPFGARELDPYYDELTEHVGVTGVEDELQRFFGSAKGCLPPLRLSRLGDDVLRRYRRKQAAFARRGVHLGLPRMAVLSREHRGRPAYDYQGLEFFRARLPSIYNPSFTLQELVDAGRVRYERPWLVTRYRERGNDVVVSARNPETGETRDFSARAVVLAAGALNTAKIVLASAERPGQKLPLLDNQISYVPFVGWRHIGSPIERESLPIQLNVVVEDDEYRAPIQGSLYGVTATLWNDLLFDFPFGCRDNIRVARALLPSMIVVQFFYPDEVRAENFVQLQEDGTLLLEYEERPRGRIEAKLVRLLRKIGYLGSSRLCKYPSPGNSFHYAGCLPMRADPGPFETDSGGRLFGSRGVYVADAASFSSLASKNLTFTIMANAMRVADGLRSHMEAP